MIPSDDPARDWDACCARREAEWAAYVRGKTCRDCALCLAPPDGKSAWGWCPRWEDWVGLDDPVSETECEGFE